MTKQIKTLVLIATLFLVSGCTLNFNTGAGSTSANDGGVYKSTNKGDSWQQKVLIPSISGRPSSIGSIDVNTLILDPSDSHAVYLGSAGNGLFYSYDNISSWQLAKSLGKASVQSIAVDYKDKCTIYSSVSNKLYRSDDCNRTWSQIYYDNDTQVAITSIAIDHFNTSNIYIGTTRGEIIKSYDKGGSWQTVYRINDEVKKITINPLDSRVIIVGSNDKGIFRSLDSGRNWQDLEDILEDYKEIKKFRDLDISADNGTIYMATYYGLLKSSDNGTTWETIELITPEKKASINAIAVNPENYQEIYYVTNTTFYRSLDGGQSWTTKKLPSSRAGWQLLINSEDTSEIYLGVKKLK